MNGIDWSKYPDFREEEFRCNCCGRSVIQMGLLDALQQARTLAGVPFLITSGYRCPIHNRKVGGVEDSAHTRGLAVDIKFIDTKTAFTIVKALIRAGFERIGIGSGFVHADIDTSKPAPTFWVYR